MRLPARTVQALAARMGRPDLAEQARAVRRQQAPGRASEDELARQLRAEGLEVVQQWRLSPARRCTADLYLPAHRLAVEVDGGAHRAGQQRQEADLSKLNLYAALGIWHLHVTPRQVWSGAALVIVLDYLEATA